MTDKYQIKLKAFRHKMMRDGVEGDVLHSDIPYEGNDAVADYLEASKKLVRSFGKDVTVKIEIE